MKDHKPRALIVEDEPGTRRLLQEVLQNRGNPVDACGDGETGWIAYQRELHPLVLLDLKLPGMDGIEVCRKIRRSPGSDETVVVFVTAVEEPEALQDVLEAGANDYIRKPVDGADLEIRLAIAERRIRERREQKETEAHLRQNALYDRLTGLANRIFLENRIDHSARRNRREEHYHFSVLYLDLCDFASVNDRYGRETGDRLLQEVARRLEETVRSIDYVARIAADRFAILLAGHNDLSDPSRVATRIFQDLSTPFDLDGERVDTSACIGIALSASGYEGAKGILRDAHSALERSKAEGPGTYRIFDPVIHAKAMARIETESRIRVAIDEGQMELHFQPLVRLENTRIVGFEALLRWNDPNRGPVSAQDFVPVAEGSALIMDLGSWVTDEILVQLEEWRELTSGAEPFFISMNVSGKQFLQPDLAEKIGDRMERAHLPPERLHVEITETTLMESLEAAEQVLSDLSDRGIRIQVDDFGTGYSSLSYLCRFPIDTLKIDQSFVGEMHHSRENLEVVRTILRLAQNLGMTVVAEGVETERQLATLKEMGCEMGQGYLFSRPVEKAKILDLLKNPIMA